MENKSNQDILKKEFVFSTKVSMVDKHNFYEYLWVMIDGWVSLNEWLSSVCEKLSSPFFKQKVQELIIFISSGDSFSKSMKKMPQVFSAQEVSLIEAWESTGTLSESMIKLSEDLKKIHELKNKILSALTYPFIICIFLVAAIIVVLMYVIPAIKPLFDTAGVDLPIATQALLSVSNFLIHNFALLILLVVTMVVIFVGYKNTENGKYQVDQFLLHFPLIGKVYQNYILANIASTLWRLVWAGINVVKVLNLVGKATNSPTYDMLFDDIALKVSKWEKIVVSMQDCDSTWEYFPASFLQMLSVWERTANIDKISQKINTQYEREVDYSLANMTKWIEPIAILIAWVFVVWFAFAILGAILKITQVVW